MNFIKHYSLVKKHRKEVKRLCFKCGLYWQGLIHDLSKYSFIEFSEGVKYFDGTQSPTAICRKLTGKSEAWEHHKKKNKHHHEYWMKNDDYKLMPYKYAVESICDRISACKTYNQKNYTESTPLQYWNSQKENGYKINPHIAKFYDIVFNDLKEYGENKILNKKYLKSKYDYCIKNDTL